MEFFLNRQMLVRTKKKITLQKEKNKSDWTIAVE